MDWLSLIRGKIYNEQLKRFIADNRVMVYCDIDEEITNIDLRKDATTDEVLGWLRDLPRLDRICLQGAHISDAGLANLASLTQLCELDLRSCKNISDQGMKHVAQLGNLTRLELYDTEIGDAGLLSLTSLSKTGDAEYPFDAYLRSGAHPPGSVPTAQAS